MSLTFETAVQEVYDWVDEAVAAENPRCEISGKCCRFREYGHKLYLTQVEADRLFELPLPESVNAAESDRTSVEQQCPYQVNGLCTAREHRPLGCRIFFCDSTYDERCCEITEEALKRLKDIHNTYGKAWIYQDLATFAVQANFQSDSPNAD